MIEVKVLGVFKMSFGVIVHLSEIKGVIHTGDIISDGAQQYRVLKYVETSGAPHNPNELSLLVEVL